jgi:hypothetical protein
LERLCERLIFHRGEAPCARDSRQRAKPAVRKDSSATKPSNKSFLQPQQKLIRKSELPTAAARRIESDLFLNKYFDTAGASGPLASAVASRGL